ncbi:lysophospholipid acyltransferase 2-like isoform X1 [Rhincodon typus]|uniref:lysophospholipid acyltransferase 2-like isoform X1 n=2 Tax=Rhincodon typus TaxID=259920 RepID=UPI00202F8A01|nr:lysophospholipid acyltransferase 2-like isoform X1 [Rhincodon typus]
MASAVGSTTTGSTLLLPLSEAINLSIDQVNFVVCQLFALLASVWFRLYLHPSKTSSYVRHAVATLLGLYLALFCFGWYALHFVVQSGISYYIMIIVGAGNMQKFCFVIAFGYLTLCQVSRVYLFDYGQYSADFTGPMMIITQKITSLAFEIHDGMARKEEHLTPVQKSLAIRTMPSLLEYLSYNCNFMGILAGPLYTYKDYTAFIEGRTLHVKCTEVNGKVNGQCGKSEPSPVVPVLCKLLVCGIALSFHLTVTKAFPVEYNIDETFVTTASLISRVLYLYFSLLAARPKYYFAWNLADAINNAAGFGFNGYDEKGNARWDLISNLNIVNIEFATSFKMFIDNWNIQTALWFKRVCYDRCLYYPTAATFVLSAMWHGVYPGYYMTFLTGIPMTLAARAIRNNFRSYFLKSPAVKLLYDVITWIATMIAISYTVVPFVLLSVESSLKFYRSWYYGLHIVALLVILALPMKPRKKENEQNHSKQKWKEVDNVLTMNSHSATNNNLNQIPRPS